ncbi:hypothetical protein [Streptomyces rochei]|uniref:hypothetical protein n=1 Tax=Streptomyces rochei TaxID=1928 RepID=UPI0036FE6361
MAISFDAFFWSLTQQESGGNYNAVGVWVGGDRAYGRYQVMGANIPSWTRQYYGRALTPGQFLANRAAQDAVARGKLKSYVNKYGYRGAAAAWYSGNASLHMSTRPQPGGPSIKGYVDSIMNRALTFKGGGGGGGSYSGGGYTPPPPVQVKLSREELAEQYGLTSALINSSKELKSLFNQAVSGQWSAAKFQAKLKNSNWWKKQPSSLRKYLTQKYTDPATWKQGQGAAEAKFNNMAIQVGLSNQIVKGKGPTSLLKKVMYWSTALGWTDARIKNYLGQFATTHGGQMWGEAGEAFDKLHEFAYLNGMRYSQDWYKKQAQGIVAGRTTIERAEAYIRSQASARYATFAEQIRAGQNVLDLAAPYIKSMSTILELPETDIDLFTKHIQNAMSGKEAGFTYPLWKFENDLRADPLWRKTNNARESMMTVAHQVAKDFGLAY